MTSETERDQRTKEEVNEGKQASDVSALSGSPALSTPRRWLVGPLLVLYMSGYMMSYFTVTEYTNHVWLNKKLTEANMTEALSIDSQCDTNTSDPQYKIRTSAAALASRYIMYYSLASGLPGVVANLVWGSYTDAFGRKFLLTVGTIGSALRLSFSVFIINFKMDLLFFTIACFIEGSTGQYGTYLLASTAYVCDITYSSKGRAMGLALLCCMLGVSLTLASFVAGYLMQSYGYFVPIVTAAGLLVINLLIMLLFLPESLPRNKRVKSSHICSMVTNCFKFFVERGARNQRWKYQILLAAHALCDFANFGRVGVETLYQMAVPICWGASKVGIYSAARIGVMVLVGIGPVRFYKRMMSDVGMAMLGVTSYAAGFILEAFATDGTLLYAAAAVGCFGSLESIMVKTIASILTDSKQQGAIFSAISAVEIVMNLVSNVGTAGIYSLSVGFMRGFVFLVMAGTNIVALLLLSILYFDWKKQEHPVAELVYE